MKEVKLTTEKKEEVLSTLRKMQIDCYNATSLMKEIQDFFKRKFIDFELDLWVECGVSILIETLFETATGRKMGNTEAAHGHIVYEPLTQEHLKILEGEYGLDLKVFDSWITRLDELQKTDYFDMVASRGVYIINDSEFTGEGVTGFFVTPF